MGWQVDFGSRWHFTRQKRKRIRAAKTSTKSFRLCGSCFPASRGVRRRPPTAVQNALAGEVRRFAASSSPRSTVAQQGGASPVPMPSGHVRVLFLVRAHLRLLTHAGLTWLRFWQNRAAAMRCALCAATPRPKSGDISGAGRFFAMSAQTSTWPAFHVCQRTRSATRTPSLCGITSWTPTRGRLYDTARGLNMRTRCSGIVKHTISFMSRVAFRPPSSGRSR